MKIWFEKTKNNIKHIYKNKNFLIISIYLTIMNCTEVFAADDMWTKAKSIMSDVYSKVLGISTVAAVVTASIALLLMNFSRSGKTVDEYRAWLKHIVITWIILNSLGFIMAYVTTQFTAAQYIVSMAFSEIFLG